MFLCLHVVQRLKKLQAFPELHYLSEDERELYYELIGKLTNEKDKFYKEFKKRND